MTAVGLICIAARRLPGCLVARIKCVSCSESRQVPNLNFLQMRASKVAIWRSGDARRDQCFDDSSVVTRDCQSGRSKVCDDQRGGDS